MIESAFIAAADRLLAAIGDALDASDADVDWRLDDGVLEIDCSGTDGTGGKIIVNRHVANREIWLATRGGGYHYRLEGDTWRDTRGGDPLPIALARALAEQAAARVELTI